MASPISPSIISESNEYHPLCRPEEIKTELTKELTKQTALLVIAILAFIAITVVAIVLCSIFFPAGLTIVFTVAGVSIPFVFGLFFAKPYTKRLELLSQIETENQVISKLDEDSIKDPKAVMEARIAVADEENEEIIRRFMPNSNENIRAISFACVPLEAQVKLKKLAVDCLFYAVVSNQPFLNISLDQWRIFHHQDLNYNDQIAMYADRRTAVSIQQFDDDGNPIFDENNKPVMDELMWSQVPFRLRNPNGSITSVTINNEKSLTIEEIEPPNNLEDPASPPDNSDNEA
ncbi:MAG: hypothetical protein S4CHLAM20_09760 [Chlamydiia bacterium]|nr:hypothetical protein [Chlamydiia bacterium]